MLLEEIAATGPAGAPKEEEEAAAAEAGAAAAAGGASVALLLATHNRSSAAALVRRMDALGVRRDDGRVHVRETPPCSSRQMAEPPLALPPARLHRRRAPPPRDGHVAATARGRQVAQILGMADDLTLSLGLAGLNSLKLVPYGELVQVLPWLLRRLDENQDGLGAAAEERPLLRAELRRRLAASVGLSV